MGRYRFTDAPIESQSDLYMGADINHLPETAFYGTLDNVYIWKRVFDTETISEHMKKCLADIEVAVLIADMNEVGYFLHDFSNVMFP